jgi:ABC-2 type transport system ATP-binding protein
VTQIIEISNLVRTFAGTTAVASVSFSVGKGEIFGLVGPDGAGKTTTLRILCGLMNPTSGTVRIAGLDVTKDTEAVKDRIGYMAQKFGLYPDLTVEENMVFYADLFGITGTVRTELTAKLLQMTRMEPFRDRQAAKLSGGMKQKLALMCTLLHKPEILVLDEPTNGVDPVSRRDFWTILRQLVKEGLTVLVTTAYLDEADLCDRVALMQSLPEACYEVRGGNLRELRERLRVMPGISDVELAGSKLHVFVRPGAELPVVEGMTARRVTPSLEDVFIASVRDEDANAA